MNLKLTFAMLFALILLMSSCQECRFVSEPIINLRFESNSSNPTNFSRVYAIGAVENLLPTNQLDYQVPLGLDRDNVVYVFEYQDTALTADTLVIQYDRQLVNETRCGLVMKISELSIDETRTTFENTVTTSLNSDYELFISL